ncbi:hypothetical protein NUSPORA_00782 [Nucleospora cyclopteri]
MFTVLIYYFYFYLLLYDLPLQEMKSKAVKRTRKFVKIIIYMIIIDLILFVGIKFTKLSEEKKIVFHPTEDVEIILTEETH